MTFDEYSALPNKKWYQVTDQGYFEAGAASRDAEIDGLHQQLADCYDALKEIQAIAESSVKTHGYDKAHIRVADIAKRALP